MTTTRKRVATLVLAAMVAAAAAMAVSAATASDAHAITGYKVNIAIT